MFRKKKEIKQPPVEEDLPNLDEEEQEKEKEPEEELEENQEEEPVETKEKVDEELTEEKAKQILMNHESRLQKIEYHLRI